MIAESRATMSSRSCTIDAEPQRADVVLHQHAVVAVVVGRAEAAVDLRGREDEAAPAAERDDLVHGDVGHRAVPYPPWRPHLRLQRRSGRASASSLHEYEHDPSAASYGDEAAEKLDVAPERLFKTLVVSVDGELAVACVPVTAELDLKALGKRAQLADKGQAQRATGYVSGGTSPLGQRRQLPTHVDASALGHETILVNAAAAGCRWSSTRTTSSGSPARASTR